MDVKNNLAQDASFGIIPLKKEDGQWWVFIIQHAIGHWGFPKGHPESAHEKPKIVAQRELTEETGLRVTEFLSIEPFCEHFNCVCQSCQCEHYGKFVHKIVMYFAAYVTGDPSLCPKEVSNGTWVTFDEAAQKFQYPEQKRMLKELERQLG